MTIINLQRKRQLRRQEPLPPDGRDSLAGRSARRAPPNEGFYETRMAARLARVPSSTLGHWVSEGVATPSQQVVDARGDVIEKGFSFSDVAYLRLLRHFRVKGVPMENAVDALIHLQDRLGPPGPAWRDAKVFVHGRRIYAYRPDQWGTTLSTRRGGGQRVEERLFGELFPELRDTADSLLIPSQFLEDIEINPAISGGLPVIRGTRIPTSAIRALAEEKSQITIGREIYPFLQRRQVKQAIEFEFYLDEGEKRAA